MEKYLIIPISLLQDRIDLAEREEQMFKDYDLELAGQAARNRKNLYQMLLNDKNIKRIDLDEETLKNLEK